MDSNSLCYKDGPQLPPLNFTTTCISSGRYVIFFNERLNGVTYPEEYEFENVYTELCEVTVNGKESNVLAIIDKFVLSAAKNKFNLNAFIINQIQINGWK